MFVALVAELRKRQGTHAETQTVPTLLFSSKSTTPGEALFVGIYANRSSRRTIGRIGVGALMYTLDSYIFSSSYRRFFNVPCVFTFSTGGAVMTLSHICIALPERSRSALP